MESRQQYPTFEEIAQQRQEVIDQAELIRTSEHPIDYEVISELGERAFSLAQHDYTYPAQAEYMMTHVAASTKDPSIIDKAHKTIDNVFSSQPDHLRAESHDLANRTIELTNKQRSMQQASGIAIEQSFMERYNTTSDGILSRMMEHEADLHEQRYNKAAEKYDPREEVVSQKEAYGLWKTAFKSLEVSQEEVLRQIAAEEIAEVAEIVAAKVLPSSERGQIDQEAVSQAGDEHREAAPIDAYIVAQTAREIKERLQTPDTHVVEALTQLADTILEHLPEADKKSCEAALAKVDSEHMSPLEAAQEIDKDHLFTKAA